MVIWRQDSHHASTPLFRIQIYDSDIEASLPRSVVGRTVMSGQLTTFSPLQHLRSIHDARSGWGSKDADLAVMRGALTSYPCVARDVL